MFEKKSKRIRISDLITAARRGGYSWGGNPKASGKSRSGVGFGSRYTLNPTAPYCILEQAAINLNLPPIAWASIADRLSDLGFSKGEDQSLGGKIYQYNDNYASSYEDAVTYMKKLLGKYGAEEIEITY